jgi:hypothetical protein
MLKLYTKRSKKASIPFDQFISFAKTYLDKQNGDREEIQLLKDGTTSVVTADLEALAGEGRCGLEYEDVTIKTIHFPDYFIELIHEEYDKLRDKPELPFPDESTLGVEIPPNLVTNLDVKQDFVAWLDYEELSKPVILRLDFPEGIRVMVLTSSILFNHLLRMTLSKIKRYITDKRNVNYVYSKLETMFAQKKAAIKEMLDDIMLQQNKALGSITKPTDFSFRFWSALANLILQEYKQKTNKLPDEHSYCQAAYLVGYYNAYHKGVEQKEKSVHDAYKQLEKQLRRKPYIFTLADITNFRDERGIPLTKKYTREGLHNYLGKKTKPQEEGALPEIVRVKGLDKRDHFIQKDVVPPLVTAKVKALSSLLNKQYREEWLEQLKHYRKAPEMLEDVKFVDDIVRRVKNEDPLLLALLRFDLLYLAYEEGNCSREVSDEIASYFDRQRKTLIPIDRILRLDREELLKDAKIHLPLWQNIPLVGGLIMVCKRIFSTKRPQKRRRPRKREEAGFTPSVSKVMQEQSDSQYEYNKTGGGASSKATTKAQLIEYRKQLDALKKRFVEEGKTVDGSLEELIDRWNPLYDPNARANLVEDVNAMVRDFLRGLRRGFRVKPPDEDRIRTMAERLAANKAFNEIKRKDYFKRYIEIYMIKLLSKR